MGYIALVLNTFFLKESYPPVVLIHKAENFAWRTRNWGIHAKQEEVELDLRELMINNLSRPIRLLITEPLMLAVILYLSFIYGLLYCFLTAYPIVFQGVFFTTCHLASAVCRSLVYGRRLCVACSYVILSEPFVQQKTGGERMGIPVPEWRLPPVIIGGVLFAGGCLGSDGLDPQTTSPGLSRL